MPFEDSEHAVERPRAPRPVAGLQHLERGEGAARALRKLLPGEPERLAPLPEVLVHGTRCTWEPICMTTSTSTNCHLPDTSVLDPMGAMSDDEPYHERLRRLRSERGLSRGQLYKLTRNVGIDTLIALEREPGSGRSRYPSAATLEDVAQALGVDPSEFPEYRLAKARGELDERVHGLGGALTTLGQITDALRIAATMTASEAERRARSGQQQQANPGEAEIRRAARGRGA